MHKNWINHKEKVSRLLKHKRPSLIRRECDMTWELTPEQMPPARHWQLEREEKVEIGTSRNSCNGQAHSHAAFICTAAHAPGHLGVNRHGGIWLVHTSRRAHSNSFSVYLTTRLHPLLVIYQFVAKHGWKLPQWAWRISACTVRSRINIPNMYSALGNTIFGSCF